MKALELAKTVEHWVSCDAGIRGEECRAAAAELRRLAEVNAELLEALEKITACDFSHLIPSKFLDPALEIIVKAKEQQ